MDRAAWWATVHGVAKSQMPLSDSAHKEQSVPRPLTSPRQQAAMPPLGPQRRGLCLALITLDRDLIGPAVGTCGPEHSAVGHCGPTEVQQLVTRGPRQRQLSLSSESGGSGGLLGRWQAFPAPQQDSRISTPALGALAFPHSAQAAAKSGWLQA